MKSYTFRVVVEEDTFADGREAYHVYVPALKGCRSWGYTLEEALRNIQEAIEVYIEDLLKQGEPIPEQPKGEVEIKEEPRVTVTIP
jgi:predicted RNase H-like HicB family nuclease